MSHYDALPKTYDPKSVEDKWYKYWMEKGYFQPILNPMGLKFLNTASPSRRRTSRARFTSATRSAIRSRTCSRVETDAGVQHPLPARHRPRRHRHPEQGRAAACRGGPDPSRPRARGVPEARLGSGKSSTAARSSTSSSAWASRSTGSASGSQWTSGIQKPCCEAFVRLFDEGLHLPRRRASSTGARAAIPAISDIEVEYVELTATCGTSTTRWRTARA